MTKTREQIEQEKICYQNPDNWKPISFMGNKPVAFIWAPNGEKNWSGSISPIKFQDLN